MLLFFNDSGFYILKWLSTTTHRSALTLKPLRYTAGRTQSCGHLAAHRKVPSSLSGRRRDDVTLGARVACGAWFFYGGALFTSAVSGFNVVADRCMQILSKYVNICIYIYLLYIHIMLYIFTTWRPRVIGWQTLMFSRRIKLKPFIQRSIIGDKAKINHREFLPGNNSSSGCSVQVGRRDKWTGNSRKAWGKEKVTLWQIHGWLVQFRKEKKKKKPLRATSSPSHLFYNSKMMFCCTK